MYFWKTVALFMKCSFRILPLMWLSCSLKFFFILFLLTPTHSTPYIFFFYLSFSCVLVLVSLFSWLWDKKENTSSHNKPKKCLRLWEDREKMRDKEKERGERGVLNTRERFHVVSHMELRYLSPTTITKRFFLFSEWGHTSMSSKVQCVEVSANVSEQKKIFVTMSRYWQGCYEAWNIYRRLWLSSQDDGPSHLWSSCHSQLVRDSVCFVQTEIMDKQGLRGSSISNDYPEFQRFTSWASTPHTQKRVALSLDTRGVWL